MSAMSLNISIQSLFLSVFGYFNILIQSLFSSAVWTAPGPCRDLFSLSFFKNIRFPRAVIAVMSVITAMAASTCKSMSPSRGADSSDFLSADCSFCTVGRGSRSEDPCRGCLVSLEEGQGSHVRAVKSDGVAGTSRAKREVPRGPRRSGRASP